MKCKNCGNETNNGTNFCNKKCRKAWTKKHDKIYKKICKKDIGDLMLENGFTGRGIYCSADEHNSHEC